MTSHLGIVFTNHPAPVFDDDGCTFVEEKAGTVFRKPGQSWKDAFREARMLFEKLYDLQVGHA